MIDWQSVLGGHFAGIGFKVALCTGAFRQLYHRYERGLENQLGSLDLVLNCVVLWTTVYLDAAVRQLKAQSYLVREEALLFEPPLDPRLQYAGEQFLVTSPPGHGGTADRRSSAAGLASVMRPEFRAARHTGWPGHQPRHAL